jgi:hypothetical protein
VLVSSLIPDISLMEEISQRARRSGEGVEDATEEEEEDELY